jgi:hypothetical protein
VERCIVIVPSPTVAKTDRTEPVLRIGDLADLDPVELRDDALAV